MIVYVERKVLEDPAIAGDDAFRTTMNKFCTFRDGTKHHPSRSVT
jgi:NAD+ kinase